MSDFKTWCEVREYLFDGEYEPVFVGAWSFCGLSMSCWEGCCDDRFESENEVMEAIMRYADNDLEKVRKL